MASFDRIKSMDTINDVDADKMRKIADSILANGWNGAPILYCLNGLITGSHRLSALLLLDEEYDISEWDVCEDVTDLINDYCEREGIIYDELPFDNLRPVFEGTWIEKYADQIKEWA